MIQAEILQSLAGDDLSDPVGPGRLGDVSMPDSVIPGACDLYRYRINVT